MRFGRIILTALLAVGVARADEVDAFLRDLGERLGEHPAVYCEFRQSRHLSLLRKPLESTGALCFQRPGYLRWQTETPFRSITLSTPEQVAQYEWMDDHWQRLDLGMEEALRRVMNEVSGLLEGRLAERRQLYTIALEKTDNGAPRIVLTPRSAGAGEYIERIEVRFNAAGDQLAGLVLREPGGDYTSLDFSDQRLGPAFAPGTFDLNAPLPLDDAKTSL